MKRNKHLFAHLHKRFIGQVSMGLSLQTNQSSHFKLLGPTIQT